MIEGVAHGKWEYNLSVPGRWPARLTVECHGSKVQFVYEHDLSIEVGPMGHYENDTFVMKRGIWEGFFSDRDGLMKCLMDFIPRTNNTSEGSPLYSHALDSHKFPDDKLKKILTDCFL